MSCKFYPNTVSKRKAKNVRIVPKLLEDYADIKTPNDYISELQELQKKRKQLQKEREALLARIQSRQKRLLQAKILLMSKHNILARIACDSSFRKLLWSGCYTYVQGYFILTPIAHEILKNNLLVQKLFENPLLRDELSGFFMREETVDNSSDGYLYINTSHEFRVSHYPKEDKNGNITVGWPHNSHTAVFKAKPAPFESSVDASLLFKIATELNNINKNKNDGPPEDFKKIFALYTKGYTYEELEELTGISSRTIRRIANEKGKRPQLQHLVAICIAVHLKPHKSNHLISMAGYVFRDTKEELAYCTLLEWAYMYTVPVCNELLIREGFKPLTSLTTSDKLFAH